ncbi:alkaline phosphatase [Rhodocyclus gracilis]|uniref:Alkaline phosphatase n=1 Tax=Rhodocyclus tenuis TaxID=1066 RepID=A0A6L5JUI1_RHOTE|nr:alkaline phosphatase [Rhodocyclus gracilis]MQY51015.1 alkaline phosphatase [Rhodocyclus gracilis]
MPTPCFARKILPALLCALAAAAGVADAAPTISRLTPPSNPLSADAVTLARFLPGQRFDLQATVRPDAGQTISSVEFKVDGVSVGTISGNGVVGNKSLLPATAITATVPNAVAASLRAYSTQSVGVHTLTAVATQSDGSVVSRDGNFEVVGIVANNGRPAKNIIIMLGDGMGAAHRTAARIMAKGYAQGKAQGRLAMDTFPYTGMVMTASLDSIVTDSAPGMANYVTGNKAQNNQEGVFPDDTTDAFDNPRVEYLSEYLHRNRNTALGIVTTADVFDATPAANAVHTSNRGNGTGIVDQFLDDRKLTGLTVLMGGGRKWFLPNASNSTNPQATNGSQRKTSTDYVLPDDLVAGWGASKGKLDAGRDLIADFQSAGYTYAPDKSALDAAGVPDKLLGLFTFSNMNVALDKINARRGVSTVVNDYGFPDQPMLDEMTDKALKVLNKNNANGFVLMVEGASIDKQAHLMDSDRWILETIEFDRAIQKAKDFATANPDTLVIVTADHECAGAAIIGAYTGTGASKSNVATYEAAKFPKYTINADGYPQTTDIAGKMLIGYGANADRYETWQAYPQPAQDSQQPFVGAAPLNTYPVNAAARTGNGFLISGQVSGEQAVHTATDIPLSAYGRGASLFTGVFDNTDVFFKLGQIAIGGAK